MSNVISNVKGAGGIIAKAMSKEFSDNLAFCKSIGQADESDFNGKNGFKAGDTIYINQPMRSIPTSSFDQTSTKQAIVEPVVPLTLDIISSSFFELSTEEFATEMALESVMKRVLMPAARDLAHDFENKVLNKATLGVFNHVGTPGSTVFDTNTILSAREKMSKYLAPKDDKRYFLFDSTAGRSAVDARKGLFQSSSEIAKQYKQGFVGTSDGYHWLESEMLQSHTNGTDVTGVQVNATLSAQGSTSMVVKGVDNPAGTFTKGQVFTIAGVYAVHPVTRKPYPFLQQFVVAANVGTEAATTRTVTFSPAIHTTGSLQNVTAFPQENANLVFVGAASAVHTQNLAFHKNAFRLATVPLIMPTKAEFAAQHRYQGMNIAIVYDWDNELRSMGLRVDILGALAIERPEWACRIS
jgi:hypothetical protein